jgi:uncharacterized protein (DUF4415 family)
MKRRPPLTDAQGEVRELAAVDLAEFRPAHEVLPTALCKTLGVRGPQKAPIKRPTTIRFDADVLAALKATGRGWQTRVNEAMREWVKGRQ